MISQLQARSAVAQSSTAGGALLLAAIVCLCPAFCPAWSMEPPPNYAWGVSIGDSLIDQGWGVAAASDGSVYYGGIYMLSPDFDPGDGEDFHPSAGGTDIFLSRLDRDGSYVGTWTVGGTHLEFLTTVAVDAEDNILYGGRFSGGESGIDFDPTEGVDIHVTTSGEDAFVTKLNRDGTYGWTRTFGGTGSSDQTCDVAADLTGNVYITGTFSGTVDFDHTHGEDIHVSNGREDVFVTRLGPDGSYGWTRTIGSAAEDHVFRIAVGFGSVAIAGSYEETMDLEELGPFTAADAEDFYVLKMDVDGSFEWFYSPGCRYDDVARGVAIGPNGDILATGGFRDFIDFDPGPGIAHRFTHGGEGAFVVSLHRSGEFRWVSTFIGYNGEASGRTVSANSDNSPLITGTLSGSVDFDPGEGESWHDGEIFVTKLTPQGEYLWTETVSGHQGQSYLRNGTIDPEGNPLITGFFSGSMDLDPTDGEDVRVSNGTYDAFLVKMELNTSAGISIVESLGPPDAGSGFPNPFRRSTSIEYTTRHPGRVAIRVYSVSGDLVRTLVDHFQRAGAHIVAWDGRNDQGRHVSPGVYLCTVEASEELITRKLHVVR